MSILALAAFAALVFAALALLRASVNGKVNDHTVYAGLVGILATMMGILFLPAILTVLMVLSMIPLYLIGWHVVDMIREARAERHLAPSGATGQPFDAAATAAWHNAHPFVNGYDDID